MRGVIQLDALSEALGGRVGELDGGAARLAGGDRVDALPQQSTALVALLARFGRDIRPKPCSCLPPEP